MPLNPLNELKRRLDDDVTPLPKRLCLAKNIVNSYHFPTAPKERIIAEWLESLSKENKLSGSELQKVLDWLGVDDLTGELKSKLIGIVSQYVKKNILDSNDIHYIIPFLENPKISPQLCQQIDDYLSITITLLQVLRSGEKMNVLHSQQLLQNFINYYKESKKKLEFIIKFLEGENLETVFSYLYTECRGTVIEVCQYILFPITKKTYFFSYLQTLVRKDNLEQLIAERGDNIQSVLKIMNTFFEFPKHRTEVNTTFLQNFIDVFVSCYRSESQIIFAFFIMVANVLNMEQNYIVPSTSLNPIILEDNKEKVTRNLFLNMLEIVLKNEVDISIKLTDTLGERASKVEIKKSFALFLQGVMMGQLKLEGKVDKMTLQIIKTAIILDPILIEQKMDKILPPIMASKKSSNILETYKETLNCLLQILFKLSRGSLFFNQILPSVKLILEASNTETDFKKRKTESGENSSEKLKTKLVTGNDIFPRECVETFGKLTTDLMFRQNKELLDSLQKDFEEHCLIMLGDGFVSPSIITVAEVLSAILSSFLRHSKMADHTVPQQIAEDFWNIYRNFEQDFLKKFGQCLLKLDNNLSLLQSFLNICLAISQLKLLNIKYSNYKIDASMNDSTDVFNLSVVLPCLSGEEWLALAGKVETDEAVSTLNNLLLMKTMAIELLSTKEDEEINQASVETKSHLIKQLNSQPSILENDKFFPRALFNNLDRNQYKQLAKVLVKLYLNDHIPEVFNDVAISNNRLLLNALVLEVAKNITKCLENCESLTKALNKSDFNMAAFAKEIVIKDYFIQIGVKEGQDDKIKKCIEVTKLLRISYLEENYQQTAMFVLLALKKCYQSKKIRKNIDYVLQNIFELSFHAPDLYQVFPVNFLFSFTDTTLTDLMVLKIKTSNQMLVIKNLIESAVKRVKTESHLVKDIVEILVSKKLNNDNSMQAFSDSAFQMTCLILPLIVKQKKAITVSAYRSILADLQEKLQQTLLKTFKNVDFSGNGSLFVKAGNTDDGTVESDGNMAALNAIAAYTLTLSRYCETTDVKEIQNLDCLWSGLEFFIQNAIQSIANPDSKIQHIETSIQLLNVTLRHIKKLETHPIFNEKDKLSTQIWQSIISRLKIVFQNGGSLKNGGYLEELGVTLKFVCEMAPVDIFVSSFVADLTNLVVLKRPIQIVKDDSKSDLTNHTVSKYLWTQCLKANTTGPKCGAMTKLMFQNSRNLKSWIRQHYDSVHNVASKKKRKLDIYNESDGVKSMKVDDCICDILRVDLDTLTEVIFAGKRITLDYKFLDSIFELQHMIHYILGFNAVNIKCEITWHSFFTLYEGCVAILNSLLVAREEILEDRWPCYMQCYRALTSTLCERSTSHVQLERGTEEKLAELAHSIEKLTQSITKRKKQVSRIAAYSVADICIFLEKNAPSRMVRQHLENSVAMLMQASDSTYAMAFLKRALAGSIGQMTMTNLYTMYKRYHKYTGNA